jgi:pimeloyl-ACP methyl ester carboxylesterase
LRPVAAERISSPPIPKPKKRKASQGELRLEDDQGLSTARQQYDLTSIINQVRGGQVLIVGGVIDVPTAFVRLGRRVAEKNADEDLAAACDESEQKPEIETLWRLVEQLLGVTNLLDFYWSPSASAQQTAMKCVAGEGSLLHALTTEVVLRDFLERKSAASPLPWHAPIRVCMGRYDPFYRPEDVQSWQALLPSSSLEIVDAGHFPHLELPPYRWMSL